MSVEAWLTKLGLGQYASAFAENGVDLSLLPELTNEDLKDLGVHRLVDRKAILKAIARFSESEHELAAKPPAPATIAGENRQVTVMFADIVGYTKLSSDLGAEETHTLLNRYFEAVDGIVVGYGGSIDKHMGDNVMAVFGAPVAHDDDPLRAVRAALDIHQQMRVLGEALERPLNAHIGIASGQVVASGTGSEAHSEYTVIGDPVNLAARLQGKAAPGETLIADGVHGVIMDAVDCDPLGEVSVKGFDSPVRTWRVSAVRTDDGAEAHIAFVGRHAEIGQFMGLAEACRRNSAGQAVVVRGEAGIGKTRLVEEFMTIAEGLGFINHKALVLDFGVGKGQDAIRTIVGSLMGLRPDTGEAARQTEVDTAIANGVLRADRRVFLNDLLDIAQPNEERAMYDAMDNATRNDGKRKVIADFIRNVSAGSPIMLIIENIHWANQPMLGDLAAMARAVADCPALLVMSSRIEGYPLDSKWRATTEGCPLMTIDLGPLRRTDAQALTGAFVDATNQFAQNCIDRAGGNPLFLEQLLRAAETFGEDEVPASIQSSVLARVDRLSPDDKHALQAASVIGQRFELDLLRHLLDDDGFECGGLLDHHLVRPEGDSFLFAHALIRDGVHSSLLKTTRRALHTRAASWFADHDLVLRAEHLDRADSEDAPTAYLEAAQGQASLYRYERAVELIERGQELAKGTEQEFALTSLHGQLLNDIGIVPESLATYRRALALAADEVERCKSLIGIAAGLRLTNESSEAFEMLQQAEPIAMQHGLTLDLARLHHLRGNLYFPLGKVDACEEAHRRGLEFARRAGSPEAEARSLGGMGDATYARGQMVTAHRYFSDCVALCQRHGFGRVEVAHLAMVGWTLHYQNELHAALDAILSAIEASKQVGDRRAELLSVSVALMITYELGDMSRAPALIERMRELVEQLGARAWEPGIGLHVAQFYEIEGRHQQAIDEIERCIPMARERSVGFYAPRMLGYFAMITDDPVARTDALSEGEAMLREGSLSHNFLGFYRYAMDACLKSGNWDEAERYAAALENYTQSEPLPLSNFYIARGRAVAQHGRGQHGAGTMEELKHLRDEAKRVGLRPAIAAIEKALVTH